MKRTTLTYKKQIASKRGYVTNKGEYYKGYERGKKDASNQAGFGQTCAKITMSYCIGYKAGWRSLARSAKSKNFAKWLETLELEVDE